MIRIFTHCRKTPWQPSVAVARIGVILIFTCFLSPAYSQYSWSNVAIGGGGFVSSIIAAPNDPNIFYARTDVGGAYRWEESTESWIPLTDWASVDERGLLGIDGIAIDPHVNGRVYLLAGTTYWNNGKSMFLRSDDYGHTWDKIDVTSQFLAHGNGMGRANGERIAVDPNNSNVIFCGTRYNGLWKSTDRGSTWSQVTSYPVTTTDNESGTPILLFDATSASGGVSQTLYAGVSQADENLYVSHDAGANWSLVSGRPTTAAIMPQRFALTSDGRYLYVTYGNGAGPHAMLWNGVTDYYNRGAVYKYDTQTGTWTDISPENFMQDLDYIEEGDDQIHYGAYSGISIDPSNENRLIATSINSWRGTQYWYINGAWKDSWGDNIYVSEDGGNTWREMFRYYWTDGGYYPDYTMMDANGIPWIKGGTCHWNGAAIIDPNNSERAFVTSGNGVFATENLLDSYITTAYVNNVLDTVYHGHATWKFVAHGIEETVPEDVVSIPDGPLVSVIADYDGFVNEDLDVSSPYGRLMTTVSGATYALGTTTGLDYAPDAGKLVKAASTRSVSTQYSTIPIGPVQWSSDNGLTWTTETYTSNPPTGLMGGKVAISTDGMVTLWIPDASTTMYRYDNSSWTTVSGIAFAGRPEADKVNANLFYTYNPATGAFYVSTDKGASFAQTATVSTSSFRTARAVPDQEGHVWIPLTSGGLTKTTNSGQSFTTVSGISYCEAVGFGKPETETSYPTVFIYGTVGGVTGIFRSTDAGSTWTRINDDDHEYGGLANGEFVMGDANVFGRVYMSTAGRGIVYGEPSGTQTGNHTPVASFTTSALSGTLPFSVSFDATASSDADGDALSFSWNFGDGTSGTGDTISHTYASAGSFQTVLTVTDSHGASASATKTLSVSSGTNTNPVASFSTSTNSGNAPVTISFDASASTDADGDVLSYVWNFGDASTGSGVSVSHTYSAAGSFTVSLIVTDGNGGADTVSTAVLVTAETSGGTCDFGTPLASGLPSLNQSYNYVHVVGTGGPNLSNVTNLTINWDLSLNGLWQLSMSTNNGNPGWWNDLRTTASQTFASAQPAITFSGAGFSGLDGSYYVAIDNGNLVMVSQNADFVIYCSNSSTAPSCDSARILGVDEEESVLEYGIYPNPAVNTLTVHYQLARRTRVQMRLVNLSGQEVWIQDYGECEAGAAQQQLNVSGLQSGIYILQLFEGINRYDLKVIRL